MITPTNQRIITYLSTHSRASVEELCLALCLSRTAVLYHLKNLILEEIVIPSFGTETKERSQGRPRIFYSLTSTSCPQNFQKLAEAMLKTAKTVPDFNERYLFEIANSMVETVPNGSNIFRLNEAIKHLNDMNYSAHWQARPKGPCIFLKNCPYRSIIDRYPELCQIDSYIIQILLGVSNDILALRNDSTDQSMCAFSISITNT